MREINSMVVDRDKYIVTLYKKSSLVLIPVVILLLIFSVSVFSQITWKQAPASTLLMPRGKHGMVVYDNKLWLFNGCTATNIVYTPNGTDWTSATDIAPHDVEAFYGFAAFNGYMWILGGGKVGGG